VGALPGAGVGVWVGGVLAACCGAAGVACGAAAASHSLPDGAEACIWSAACAPLVVGPICPSFYSALHFFRKRLSASR
jgi:hypothetical protein